MLSSRIVRSAIHLSICTVVGALVVPNARGEQVRYLYEVTEGTYYSEGGIWGVWTYQLPKAWFAFIEMTVDTEANFGALCTFGANLSPGDGLIGGPVDAEILASRPIVDGRIDVEMTVPYPITLIPDLEGFLDIDVLFSEASILFGVTASYPYMCCDIPTLYSYQSVRGVAIPVDFGDFNQDRVTDFSDLDSIVGCVEGPDVEVDPTCDFVDGDGDYAVDLTDVALLQRTWNPNVPR